MPPEPLILAFDTSAAHCAAALLSGGRILAARHDPMARGQAEHLFPMLEDLLAAAGAGWRDLTALAVGTGPGNFTGVRLSVSAARGLALSLALPVHGVTRLEAAAYGLPRPCLVVLDARQGRLYLQTFAETDGTPRILAADALPDDLGCTGLIVTGDAADQIAPRLGATIAPAAMPLAEAMARIAARRPPPATRVAPLYLLPADAAPPRDAPPVILP